MKRLVVFALIGVLVLTACWPGPAFPTEVPVPVPTTPVQPRQLRVMTHDSFDIIEETLAAFDLAGRRAALLFRGEPGVGYHHLAWDGSGLPSGLYVLRLTSPSGVRMAKVAVVR